MTESYGYYTYGDVKLKTLRGKTSWGFEKTPRTINAVSKNANSYKIEIAKNYDTSNSVLSVSKNALCNGISLVKSANILFNSTDMSMESKEYTARIHDTKTMVVNTPDMGFYEITSVGQIAKYDLNISATPSNATILINGIEQSTYNGYETEEINYEVFCDGYKSISGTFNLMNDETINVELKAPTTLLRITTEPEDVIVIIDGEETHEAHVVPGETITYQVYKDGYCFENGDDVLTVEITPQDLEIEEYSYTLIQKFIQSASYLDDGITISGSGNSAFYNATYVSNAYSDGFNGVDNLTSGNYTSYLYSHQKASFLYFNFNSPKFIKTLTFSGAYYNSSNNSLVVRFYDINDEEISELAKTLTISDLFSSSTRNKVTVNVNKIISKIRFYASATSSAGYVKILSFIKIT